MRDETNEIDPNTVKLLTINICESFELFKKRGCFDKIKIDQYIVRIAVISWILDLKRHISFHTSDDPDIFKKAGYILYWLAKTKPISTVEPCNVQINSAYLTVNEEFALYHALFLLNVNPKNIGDDDLLERFVYSLYYRDDNAKSLVSKMELLYKKVPPYLR